MIYTYIYVFYTYKNVGAKLPLHFSFWKSASQTCYHCVYDLYVSGDRIRSWRFAVSLRISCFELPGLWPTYAGCRGQTAQLKGWVLHMMLAFLILIRILICTLPATL